MRTRIRLALATLLLLATAHGAQPSALNRETERARLHELVREAQLLVVAKQSYASFLKLGVVDVDLIETLTTGAMQELTAGWATASAKTFKERHDALSKALDDIPAWHKYTEHRAAEKDET